MRLAWGRRVSPEFRASACVIAEELGVDPSDLMGCIAWESDETFRADVRNKAGSGAVGLIQFMPQTAAALGTSTAALAALTPERQLVEFVRAYFKPWRGRLKNLGDLYMAILWPAGVGKPDTWNLFEKGGPRPKLYLQNAGLDLDHDGDVSRAEAIAKVTAKRDKGFLTANVWEG